MFSLRPPRKPVPASSVPRTNSSSYLELEDDDQSNAQSGSYDNGPFESISSGGWSFSATTLIDGLSARPSRVASASTRRSLRHSTPVHFSFEVPEDPLRAAIGLETVLEHPVSQPEENEVAHSLLNFSRCHVGSIKPRRSVLSAMVASQRLPNPFTGAAPVEGGPLNIKVYFPRAEQPSGKLLELALPATATVEDAIALALWTYWEKLWLPKLDASRARDTDIASWIMLVPGEDGKVNRRIAQNKISRFKFDQYAIVRLPHSLSEKQRIEKQINRTQNSRCLCPKLVVQITLDAETT
ncbi:CRIM domain-containing protein [Mycena venus]|uniref:CRIM domain-containing protein n=1 Tax=Mycena venus TaxID=2733690 RepID=A0A8H6YWE6_9AGAR|nr:CRIM domain-containing protein [Mycena venus]